MLLMHFIFLGTVCRIRKLKVDFGLVVYIYIFNSSYFYRSSHFLCSQIYETFCVGIGLYYM